MRLLTQTSNFITSHLDTLFIALYVIAFLTIVIWVTNLIVYIQNRRLKKMRRVELAAEKATPTDDGREFIEEERVSFGATEEWNEDEEGDTVIVTEEDGKTVRIRYSKSFTAKLIQSGDETKAFYRELKNEVLSYDGASSRVSWEYDSVNYGRSPLLKFGIRGKTLCVYFALNIKDLKGMKYKVELCEYKKYASVSCLYRITNAQRCEFAKDLIAKVADRHGLVKGERQNVEYAFPYEDIESLLEKGSIKVIGRQVF